jgi:hypothetical protein
MDLLCIEINEGGGTDGNLDRIIPRESTVEYQRNPMPRLTVSVRIDSTDRSRRLRGDSVFVEGVTALPRWWSWRQTGRQKALISSARHSKAFSQTR